MVSRPSKIQFLYINFILKSKIVFTSSKRLRILKNEVKLKFTQDQNYDSEKIFQNLNLPVLGFYQLNTKMKIYRTMKKRSLKGTVK